MNRAHWGTHTPESNECSVQESVGGVIEVLDDSRGSENLEIIIEAIKNIMDSLK